MSTRPTNREELYNLRHASARSVVNHTFGVLKQRFKILVCPPEFDVSTQAHIPSALAALHNFIQEHDPNELADRKNVRDPEPGPITSELSIGTVWESDGEAIEVKRDLVAQDMWDSYQALPW